MIEIPPTLSDLGISKDQSSTWQRIADVTEEDIERHNAATTVAEITRAEARRKTSHPR